MLIRTVFSWRILRRLGYCFFLCSFSTVAWASTLAIIWLSSCWRMSITITETGWNVRRICAWFLITNIGQYASTGKHFLTTTTIKDRDLEATISTVSEHQRVTFYNMIGVDKRLPPRSEHPDRSTVLFLRSVIRTSYTLPFGASSSMVPDSFHAK